MTPSQSLSATVDAILTSRYSSEVILQQTVDAVGKTLGADRCFLYLRQPERQRGRIAFCWRKDDTIPYVIQPDWQPDTTDLPKEDPLIRAALSMKPSVYVDDVETAGPDVLNQAYEHKTFGHRALIHAHIQQDGQLWGILQPCLFGRSRHWTEPEKEQIQAILPHLQPVIADFVRTDK